MATVKTICVLCPAGPNEGTKQLEALAASTTGLRIVVGRSAAEIGADVCSVADGLILWAAFRDSAREFWAMAKPAPAGPLKWVHSLFAGIDAMLFDELRAADGVTFTLTRGVYSTSLAEWAITGILYHEKQIPRLMRQKAEHKWEKFVVTEVSGKWMTVIGYGDIGHSVAQKAAALGINVVGVRRRRVAPDCAGDGVASRIVGVDRMLEAISSADYVVAAMPLTADTRGTIGRREIAAMKPSALFVNVGRGATVDEDALVEALRENKIAGAALDVFGQEPLPPDHPFWSLDNVLMSPHCADVTQRWMVDAMAVIKENIARFLAGKELLYVADKTAGY